MLIFTYCIKTYYDGGYHLLLAAIPRICWNKWQVNPGQLWWDPRTARKTSGGLLPEPGWSSYGEHLGSWGEALGWSTGKNQLDDLDGLSQEISKTTRKKSIKPFKITRKIISGNKNEKGQCWTLGCIGTDLGTTKMLSVLQIYHSFWTGPPYEHRLHGLSVQSCHKDVWTCPPCQLQLCLLQS